jgi:hypothetical protein
MRASGIAIARHAWPKAKQRIGASLITVWLQVRVLPGPPRSHPRTRFSGDSSVSPQLAFKRSGARPAAAIASRICAICQSIDSDVMKYFFRKLGLRTAGQPRCPTLGPPKRQRQESQIHRTQDPFRPCLQTI